MAMLAERVLAATAFEWDMISRVVDDAAYDDELAVVVQALADGPTESYQWMKRALSAAVPTRAPR